MHNPHLTMLLAQARQDDLRRTADARNRDRRASQTQPPIAPESCVTLRTGYLADEESLGWLAALDSAKLPAGPILLAEVDGQLRAALSLSDGTLVADPWHRTAGLIELLRARARQLEAPSHIRRARRRLRSSGGSSS